MRDVAIVRSAGKVGQSAATTDDRVVAMDLVVRQLTPDQWPDLEDLFSTEGPVGRCWCAYWRIGSGYRRRAPETNKQALRDVVEQGPPPGLLAMEGPLAVGWCQITPRDALPFLGRDRHLEPVDDLPVWSISCLYVRKGYRRRGVTEILIGAAVETARLAGASAVEAYPIDADVTSTSSFTGFATTYQRLSFETVARHVPARPIMRYTFSG